MLLLSTMTPGRLSPSSRWQSKRMSAVNTTSLLTVLQEVNLHQAAERFPDQVCCPLSVRHSLILLVWCTNMLQFEWLQPISSPKIQVPKKIWREKREFELSSCPKRFCSKRKNKCSMLKSQMSDYTIIIYDRKDTLQELTIFQVLKWVDNMVPAVSGSYSVPETSRNVILSPKYLRAPHLRLLPLAFSNILRPVWKPLPADDRADWGNSGFRLPISAVCWSSTLC